MPESDYAHVWFVFESLLLSFYKEWNIDHVEIQVRVHKFFILEMPTPEVEGLKALTNQLRCWSCHLSFLTRAEIYQIFLFILAEAICLVAKWLTLSIHSSYHVNLKVNSEIDFLVTCSLSVTYQVHATLRHLDKLSWVFYAWARLAQTELDLPHLGWIYLIFFMSKSSWTLTWCQGCQKIGKDVGSQLVWLISEVRLHV